MYLCTSSQKFMPCCRCRSNIRPRVTRQAISIFQSSIPTFIGPHRDRTCVDQPIYRSAAADTQTHPNRQAAYSAELAQSMVIELRLPRPQQQQQDIWIVYLQLWICNGWTAGRSGGEILNPVWSGAGMWLVAWCGARASGNTTHEAKHFNTPFCIIRLAFDGQFIVAIRIVQSLERGPLPFSPSPEVACIGANSSFINATTYMCECCVFTFTRGN